MRANDFEGKLVPLPELYPPPSEDLEVWERLASSHHSPVVWAEGDVKAPTVVILDNPGARECDGNAWVCPTRDTLRRTASEVGLGRLYVTWLVKFRPRRSYDKTRARMLGREAVEREIRRVAPRMVVALGDVVVSTLFRDPNAHVRDLRGHDLFLGQLPVVASYHPLAVHRRPNLRPLFVEDFERARRLLGQTAST